MFWSSKQKRCFNKVRLGVRLRKNRAILRFLTLSCPLSFTGNIDDAFSKLKKRIQKLTPEKLVSDGYVSHKNAKYFYHSKYGYNHTLSFNYVRVRTSEGAHGVLHIPFFGDYIPHEWIYDNWKDILGVNEMSHHSVDIRACRETVHDTARLSSYVINQYVANQDCFKGSSMSWSWCFRGCVSTFYKFVHSQRDFYPGISMPLILEKWDKFAQIVIINRSIRFLDVIEIYKNPEPIFPLELGFNCNYNLDALKPFGGVR
jgi:hypothetical protein